MYKLILRKLTGIAGTLLVLYGYYLLWVPAETEMQDVIARTKIAVIITLIGSVMILIYMYRK